MMDDENDDGDIESSMGRRHTSDGSSMGQKCNGDEGEQEGDEGRHTGRIVMMMRART